MKSRLYTKIVIALFVVVFWQDGGWQSGAGSPPSVDDSYVALCIDTAEPPNLLAPPDAQESVPAVIDGLPQTSHPQLKAQQKAHVLPPPRIFLAIHHYLHLSRLGCSIRFPSNDDDPHSVTA